MKGKFLAWALCGYVTLCSPIIGLPRARAEGAPIRFENLGTIATHSLESNLVSLPSGTYLRAGAHQFEGLWTRDFSFASRGLIALERLDVVRDQLDRLLEFTKSDSGLLPRYIDSTTTFWRYIAKFFGVKLKMTDHLRPQYTAGGTSGISMDSNALVLLTALQYLDASHDTAWWSRAEPTLVEIFRFYDSHIQDGLVVQGPAADWQDSVKRKGAIFYTNLLYWKASDRLRQFPAFNVTIVQTAALKRKIISSFLDSKTGLYRAILGEPYISLDGNLLAIDLGFHPPRTIEAEKLWFYLKKSPFIHMRADGILGTSTFPNYPSSWIELNVRAVGLKHYHDSIYWSWLMALAAKVSAEVGDRSEAEVIFSKLEQIAMRDGTIVEIYKNRPDLPRWTSGLYSAEAPFSWGAGMILDALKTYRELPRSGEAVGVF